MTEPAEIFPWRFSLPLWHSHACRYMYFNGFRRRVLVTRVSEITPDNNAIVSLKTSYSRGVSF